MGNCFSKKKKSEPDFSTFVRQAEAQHVADQQRDVTALVAATITATSGEPEALVVVAGAAINHFITSSEIMHEARELQHQHQISHSEEVHPCEHIHGLEVDLKEAAKSEALLFVIPLANFLLDQAIFFLIDKYGERIPVKLKQFLIDFTKKPF